MLWVLLVSVLSVLPACLSPVMAATAAQWRSRSIYQLFTDRYALIPGAGSPDCNPGDQTWCGGTWNSIRENLDYIQHAGFTAIWISPVNKNYDGLRTHYGDAYTGYWVTDVSQLNPRFGTADDLKQLSAELHRRGMYLMVDLVLNNVMATSTTPDYSGYFFKVRALSILHPMVLPPMHIFFPPRIHHNTIHTVPYSGGTELAKWIAGLATLLFPDVNTEDPSVSQAYQAWIRVFVQEFSIDGLRLDGKHAPPNFWTPICDAAGVFCIGEVFGDDIGVAASYQGPQAIDSVLNYPIYNALVQAFALPGPQNMSALAQIINQSQQQYKDVSVLGNFLENQDVPRWANMSVDIQSMFNALVFTFMSDGIPIVYYGQEQRLSGNADPWNRGALWASNYANSSSYAMIATLNKLRSFLINGTDSWTTSQAKVLAVTSNEIAIMKGNAISIMTNIGSPPRNTSVAVSTPWATSTLTLDILTCTEWTVGSNRTISVGYSKGGQALVLVPVAYLQASGFCGYPASAAVSNVQYSSGISSFSLSGTLWGVFALCASLAAIAW